MPHTLRCFKPDVTVLQHQAQLAMYMALEVTIQAIRHKHTAITRECTANCVTGPREGTWDRVTQPTSYVGAS